MAQRLDLQKKFEQLLGTRNVYFQPPESIKLQYPCIIYQLDDINERSADNIAYLKYRRYSVTYIDSNPDNTMIETLSDWPLCRFSRSFIIDNLYHYIFELYF